MSRPEDNATTIYDDPRLSELADEMAARWQAGKGDDVEAFFREHPEYESQLRRLLPAVQMMAELHDATPFPAGPEAAAKASPAGDLAPTTLGDFRLVREIGRGGMGVVYEAVQLSLGRCVALKVLPFASALDGRQLQRFKNEAQAAAHLHHTNIVPVIAVGCDRGVHYYAMQFIDGQPLAAVIGDLKRQPAASELTPPGSTPPGSTTPTSTLLATLTASKGRGRYRWAVQLGIQMAEALEHAHRIGVIHRDIKPGNILLDTAGHPWIADFGLARVQSDDNLTMTGDVIGTLRYMSPEQALGRRDAIDQRTDVYSLGATLFELLSLAPACDATDRQELLRQVAYEEPRPLRRVAPSAPAELETILLKALGKDPSERYPSAQELADDLRRFLNDEPIRARRPTAWQRVVKWSRRHRSLVWSAAASLVVTTTIVAATLGWAIRDRAARNAVTQREVASELADARSRLVSGDWAAAKAAAQRAAGQLAIANGHESDRAAADALLADVTLVEQLEQARLSRGEAANRGQGHETLHYERTDEAYARAFASVQLDFGRLSPEQARQQLAASPIRPTIAMALDDWALVRLARRPEDDGPWQRLLAIAGALDDDPTRLAVRRAVAARKRDELRKIAAAPSAADLPPQAALLLAGALMELGDGMPSTALLKRACARHPHDFWLHYTLGWYYSEVLRNEEAALPFATAAVSLRPDLPAPRMSLAVSLIGLARHEDSVVQCQEAIRLKPDYAAAHLFLSRSLCELGRHAEALAAGRRSVELEPHNSVGRIQFANTLRRSGRHDQAVSVLQGVLRDYPDDWVAYTLLGETYLEQRRWPEAAAALEEARTLNSDERGVHDSLADALVHLGRFEEAEIARREAVRLKPYDPRMYGRLANLLATQGHWREAWDLLKNAGEVWLAAGRYYWARGDFFMRKGRTEFAVADFRRALKERPNDPDVTHRLSVALAQQGNLDEAIAVCRAGYRPLRSHYQVGVELGRLLRKQGKFDDSLQVLEEVLRIVPESRSAQTQYGYTLCCQRQFDRGIDQIRQVLARDPHNLVANELLAQALTDAKAAGVAVKTPEKKPEGKSGAKSDPSAP